MTICIAAECFASDARKLILCTDWRVSSALGRSDTMVKHVPIRRNWWALTAGVESEILALRRLLDRHFKISAHVDEANLGTLVRATLAERKREKIEEFIQGRYGISYADFLSFGKDKLPTDAHREAMTSIADIRLGASVIIAGFAPDGTYSLLETDEQGRTFMRDDFATIGEGSYLARASLLQREYLSAYSLGRSIYYVYEAKKISERVTSVGEDTQISILSENGTFMDVSDEGIKFLDDCFKKHGPQRVNDTSVAKVESLLDKPQLVEDVTILPTASAE